MEIAYFSSAICTLLLPLILPSTCCCTFYRIFGEWRWTVLFDVGPHTVRWWWRRGSLHLPMPAIFSCLCLPPREMGRWGTGLIFAGHGSNRRTCTASRLHAALPSKGLSSLYKLSTCTPRLIFTFVVQAFAALSASYTTATKLPLPLSSCILTCLPASSL